MKISGKFHHWMLCSTLGFAFIMMGAAPLSITREAPQSDTQPIAVWGTGEPIWISYSADGSLMAVGTAAGYIFIYETHKYNLIQAINTEMVLGFITSVEYYNRFEHTGSVAISPDNKYVGAVAVDDSVGVWGIQDGNAKFINWGSDHGQYHHYSTWNPRKIAYFAGRGELFIIRSFNYKIFRTDDGTELKIGPTPFFPGWPENYTFLSHDLSTYMYFPAIQRTIDWLKWIRIPPANWINLKPVAYSEDGTYVLSDSSNGIALWSVPTEQVLYTIPESYGGVFTKAELMGGYGSIGAFSTDNQFFVVSTLNSTGNLVSVWEVSDHSKLGEFSIPRHPTLLISIRPTNNQMAYPVPGGVEIVKLPSGEVIKTILFGTCAGEIKLSPDGKRIASYFGSAIYICDAADGKITRTFNASTDNVTDIDWSSDSKYLLSSGQRHTGHYDTKIHIWDVDTGENVNTFDGHKGNVMMATFSPDGRLIASVSFQEPMYCSNCCYWIGSGNEIIIRQSSDGKVLSNFNPLGKLALQIGFSKDSSKSLIAAGNPCSPPVKVYFVDLSGNSTTITDSSEFIMLPNGNLLTEGGNIWDIGGITPKLLITYSYPHYPKLVSSDGRMMISYHFKFKNSGGSGVRDIFLSTLDENMETPLLQEKGNHWYESFSAAFSLDNKTVMIAPYELAGVIKVFSTFDIANLTPTTTLTPIPVPTWGILPQPPLYDDFESASLDGLRWQPADPGSALQFSYLQKDGALVLEGQAKEEAAYFELNLTKPSSRTIDQVRVFEAQLEVPKRSSGIWSFITMKLGTGLSDQRWWTTECYLTNLTSDKPTFGCNVNTYQNGQGTYEHYTQDIDVQFGQWYTLRIELDPANGAIHWYLAGQLVELYLAKDASALPHAQFRPSFAIWTDKTTSLTAEIDNVRITGGAQP